MKPRQKSPEPWGFFGKQVNRDVIGWFAGGLAAITMAAWAVFTYDGTDSPGKGGGETKNDCFINAEGSVAPCGDLNANDITINGK